jgi:hypothetical protein
VVIPRTFFMDAFFQFWILDLGFWISRPVYLEFLRVNRNPKSKIKNQDEGRGSGAGSVIPRMLFMDGHRTNRVFQFWILDLGFWTSRPLNLEFLGTNKNPKSKIQNPKSR